MTQSEQTPSIAIAGDTPEALLLSVLYAEAGMPNYLVGPFRDNGRVHINRPGIEEALWLFGIHTRSGKITLVPDYRELPFSSIRTILLASHVSDSAKAGSLELTARNLAPIISQGTTVAFMGLCNPRYTSSVLKSTFEKYGGVTVGSDIHLYYLPLFWKGERIEDFRDKPKVLAAVQGNPSPKFQEQLLRVFPSLTLASTPEAAEASGLFSAISYEAERALSLELAKISEGHQVNFEEVLELCRDTGIGLARRMNSNPGRESIGTSIALFHASEEYSPKLVRAAHIVNQEYQASIVEMIKRALRQCGHPFRRSRVAILGTDGLLQNSWTKPESIPIIDSLRKKGARISLYPGEAGSQPWAQMIGNRGEVENSLLRAVANASCAVVALPQSLASILDVEQIATEMNRPAAICDINRVLEASNVEKAGLFYTTMGRGILNS